MPELPEVENIAEGLRAEIIGRGLAGICVITPGMIRHPAAWKTFVSRYAPQRIVAVTRRAKRLIIVLENQAAILIQLGMTGKVVVMDSASPREKHTHLILELSNGRQVRLVDPRRFGRVAFFTRLDPQNPDPAMAAAGMGKLGPEPFSIPAETFRQILHSRRAIKTLLLDQSRIAGLGNIYADEALFAAGIHPVTRADQIPSPQADRLRRAIARVLNRAIHHGGTTILDYRNAYGEMGNFWKKLRVYQRTGQPCCACRTLIQRLTLAARSSHFCPQCQKPNQRSLKSF